MKPASKFLKTAEARKRVEVLESPQECPETSAHQHVNISLCWNGYCGMVEMLHNMKFAEHPILTFSLTSSFKATILGSIKDHCSTQMSVSESQEREIGSWTHYPGGSWLAVSFRIGGVLLGSQSGRSALRGPFCHGSYLQRMPYQLWSKLQHVFQISLPQRLRGTLVTIGGQEPWLALRFFQYTGQTVVYQSNWLPTRTFHKQTNTIIFAIHRGRPLLQDLYVVNEKNAKNGYCIHWPAPFKCYSPSSLYLYLR